MFKFTEYELNNKDAYIKKVRDIISKNKPAYIYTVSDDKSGVSGFKIHVQFNNDNDINSEKFLKSDLIFEYFDYISLVECSRNNWEKDNIEFLDARGSSFTKNENIDAFISLEYIDALIGSSKRAKEVCYFNLPSLSSGRIPQFFSVHVTVPIYNTALRFFNTINVKNLNSIISNVKYLNIKQTYIDSVVDKCEKANSEIRRYKEEINSLKRDVNNFINHPSINLTDEDILLLNVKGIDIYEITE